jgi:thymidylate synthase ThyX
MSQERQIYLLDPKKLSPETIAVTFAKTSRSPLTFNEIADELSDEKSADFNEKWVVGYGHSSVAEHAVLHIAVENISRLAVECLESNRLASYTEKSSRYQIWGPDHFYVPSEFDDPDLNKTYRSVCERLFTSYQTAVDQVQEHLKAITPEKEGESARAYKTRLRTVSMDVCRYYLPASSVANVGMTINARALEHAICKMLSNPLSEVREIGEQIKKVARENVPTLVKYADKNPCMIQVGKDFSQIQESLNFKSGHQEDWMQIVHADEHGEERVLAALLMRFGEISYMQALQTVMQLTEEKKKEMADTFLANLGKHDIPLREMEYADLTVEILLDQGAYFELKRHRMMTQTPQRFIARLGYAIPKLIKDAGLLDAFTADMEAVQNAYEELAGSNPEAAAYILPNAFNRRVLLQTNLRSALHFTRLRSAPNAHFAIRRVAQRLAEEIRVHFPLFASYFTPESDENWESITEKYF